MTSLNCFSNEFLERCMNITKKHEQTRKWNIQAQILKIYEEVGEVHRAIINEDIGNLKEELVDVIFTLLTMYHKLGVKPLEIQQLTESTLLKIEQRVGIKEND